MISPCVGMKVARFTDLNYPFELLALNVRDKPTRKRLAEFKTTYDTTIGLLCFSANWTNPVLWSHYGNRHRGICLGFDLKKGCGEQKVRYKDDRIRARLGNASAGPSKLSQELQQDLLCTKFSHWVYEEEIRLFVPLGDSKVRREANLHFFPFGGDLELREVILGPLCGMSLDAVRRMVDANYTGVTTIKARLAVQSFAIVPAEKTVP